MGRGDFPTPRKGTVRGTILTKRYKRPGDSGWRITPPHNPDGQPQTQKGPLVSHAPFSFSGHDRFLEKKAVTSSAQDKEEGQQITSIGWLAGLLPVLYRFFWFHDFGAGVSEELLSAFRGLFSHQLTRSRYRSSEM